MQIEIKSIDYSISETLYFWNVTKKNGAFSVTIQVSKDFAPDFKALEQYMQEHEELF